MSTPVTWYYDMTARALRDSNGIQIRNDDRRPFATLSQKFRVNLQVVTNSSLTPYTGWGAGTSFRFVVDDDYSNPAPYLPLYGDSSDSWTLSSGSEYTYVGETISSKPSEVMIDGSAASEGTVGSLAAGEWGWDSALYVRLSDDTDPDTKADGYVSQKPVVTSTQPFLYVADSTIQEAGTWGEAGTDPDITSGQLSFFINANRTSFYERLSTAPLVRATGQIQILDSGGEFMEMISFTFIARNIMLGESPSLELDVYPFYTKEESDARYAPYILKQSLGNISGSVSVDLSQGDVLEGTLTGDITSLSFTGLPTGDRLRKISLDLNGLDTYDITWPVGTLFSGGQAPTFEGSLSRVEGEVDSSGVLFVTSVISSISTTT